MKIPGGRASGGARLHGGASTFGTLFRVQLRSLDSASSEADLLSRCLRGARAQHSPAGPASAQLGRRTPVSPPPGLSRSSVRRRDGVTQAGLSVLQDALGTDGLESRPLPCAHHPPTLELLRGACPCGALPGGEAGLWLHAQLRGSSISSCALFPTSWVSARPPPFGQRCSPQTVFIIQKACRHCVCVCVYTCSVVSESL